MAAAMRRMPAKVMPMPALATGEREVFWEGEAVGVAVMVAVTFMVGNGGVGVWVVVAVEEDRTAERG
jgi:hypothetical protein